MNMLRIALFLVHCLVLLQVYTGTSVDRYESAKPRTTMVILFHTLEKTNTTGHQVDRGNVCEKYDYDEDYDLSVDYDSNQPRVAFSTKPKHLSAIPTTEKKKKKGKGKGRKKNPCLKEYKDYCIHGVCQHLKELNRLSCVCEEEYSGERCNILIWSERRNKGRSWPDV